MIEPKTLLAKSDGMSTIITMLVVISVIWQIIKRSTSEKTFRRANPIPRPTPPKPKPMPIHAPVFESVPVPETIETAYEIQPEPEAAVFSYNIPLEAASQSNSGLFEVMPSMAHMMIWKEILDVPKALNRQRRMRF